MKTKYLLATFSMIMSFTIVAQDGNNKEMKPYEIENESIKKSTKDLRDVFSKMFSNAQFTGKKETGSCKPEDLVGKISIDGLRSGDENLNDQISSIKNIYLNYPQHLTDAPSREEAYSFDIRNYKSMEDGALSSFSNTNNFADFVKVYTGVDVGDLNEFDNRTVRGQYDRLKANYNLEFHIETENFMSLSCSHKATSYIKLKKLNYPNATWQIRTVVSADCDCSITSELTKNIKSGEVEYTAETTGLLTTTAFNFGKVNNAKVKVTSLVCCPVKEEENEMALNDSDDAKGYFQVGAYVGLPLGEEKDFYSLAYGVDVSYLFNLSDYFSAGAGIGYTRFTGKDVNFGSTTFEGEGTGFVQPFTTANYALTEKVGLSVYVGYGLSTESGGDGGIYYGGGVSWDPIPGLRIRPEISFTNLDEDRSFNTFGVRVQRTF